MMNGDGVILTNARIVLEDDVIHGTIEVTDGAIHDVQPGRSNLARACDCEGDHIIPGIVELHTDNLERHMSPRPGVRWPPGNAALAHDAQVAAAGITTVFDAISIGDLLEDSPRVKLLDDMVDAIRATSDSDAFRAEHFLHLRCELTFIKVVESLERLAAGPLVHLVSIMDHSPGQRQFADIGKYRAHYRGKHGLSEEQLDELSRRHIDVHERLAGPHRERIVALCKELGIPMASHDDETEEHVAEAADAGMAISEFPTTVRAAKAARARGMKILMGAPNIVLGGSQSGNISAIVLLEDDLLDLLSSDYVPSSLVQAAFKVAGPESGLGVTLPDAVARISTAPARVAGLYDRGRIAQGLRADLVRVRAANETPVVRDVWRAGRRVA